MYGRNGFELLQAKVFLYEKFCCEIKGWKEPVEG